MKIRCSMGRNLQNIYKQHISKIQLNNVGSPKLQNNTGFKMVSLHFLGLLLKSLFRWEVVLNLFQKIFHFQILPGRYNKTAWNTGKCNYESQPS